MEENASWTRIPRPTPWRIGNADSKLTHQRPLLWRWSTNSDNWNENLLNAGSENRLKGSNELLRMHNRDLLQAGRAQPPEPLAKRKPPELGCYVPHMNPSLFLAATNWKGWRLDMANHWEPEIMTGLNPGREQRELKRNSREQETRFRRWFSATKHPESKLGTPWPEKKQGGIAPNTGEEQSHRRHAPELRSGATRAATKLVGTTRAVNRNELARTFVESPLRTSWGSIL